MGYPVSKIEFCRNKGWLRRKGCKNIALVEVMVGINPDTMEETWETRWQPYYQGREFEYVSNSMGFGDKITAIKNLYFDLPKDFVYPTKPTNDLMGDK